MQVLFICQKNTLQYKLYYIAHYAFSGFPTKKSVFEDNGVQLQDLN